jgi:hypothetical protein
VSDNEKDQNDAGESDDHFFPNGRAIKRSEDIHNRFGAASGRRSPFEIMNAARSVKATGISTRFSVLMRLLVVVE